MNKILKFCEIAFLVIFVACGTCACNLLKNDNCETAEKLELTTAVLSEVEFENSDTLTLNQKCDEVEIGGQIDAMTDAQKSVFGQSDVTHVVALKMVFDKEKTLDQVEIKGNKTKVYSTNNEVENYVGKLTDLLDSESGEDAYANLILSANTKNYTITSKYSDGSESQISIKIDASLVTAEVE